MLVCTHNISTADAAHLGPFVQTEKSRNASKCSRSSKLRKYYYMPGNSHLLCGFDFIETDYYSVAQASSELTVAQDGLPPASSFFQALGLCKPVQ